MASLKDLKNRITSVKSTQKITKAMQMVASAKLRRAEDAAAAARPYAERMAKVMAGLSEAYEGREGAPRLLAGTGSDQTHLLIVCTADRGLCGAFNSSIARKARDHANQLIAEGKTVKLITVGRKGNDILKRLFGDRILEFFTFRDVKQLSYANAEEVGKKVLELFSEGDFDVATLFYSKFKSVISQVPTAQQLIPAVTTDIAEDKVDAEAAGGSYDYEPSEEAILEKLLPRNISVQIFSALLENVAGEWGAKMSAMDNASRNAGDMIDRLMLSYNRQRQAQITTELIEIIAGAEAL